MTHLGQEAEGPRAYAAHWVRPVGEALSLQKGRTCLCPEGSPAAPPPQQSDSDASS